MLVTSQKQSSLFLIILHTFVCTYSCLNEFSLNRIDQKQSAIPDDGLGKGTRYIHVDSSLFSVKIV